MATEGGEVLLEGLLIANVGQHQRSPWQPGRAGAEHRQPCAGHEEGQTQAFENDGLAACIGSGDGHHPLVGMHLDVHRHHVGPTTSLLLPHQQWMTQLPQQDGFLSYPNNIPSYMGVQAGLQKVRLRATHGGPIATPRQGHVKPQQGSASVQKVLGIISHQSTELPQHLLLLLVLLGLQITDAVSQGHQHPRFHKQGAAGGGAVMNQPGQLVQGARFEGQHGAPMAGGDDGVLQHRLMTPQ